MNYLLGKSDPYHDDELTDKDYNPNCKQALEQIDEDEYESDEDDKPITYTDNEDSLFKVFNIIISKMSQIK